MSRYSVGDVVDIRDDDTGKVMVCVITQVGTNDGNYWYGIRRKDNKSFRTRIGVSYNAKIMGEKIEVDQSEKIK